MIMALDFGEKKTGIALTDLTQTIATGIDTVSTSVLLDSMDKMLKNNSIHTCVVGQPRRMNGHLSEVEESILNCITKINKRFPALKIERIDERFTSKIATQSMLQMGLKKKQRKNKSLTDTISATIILQSYLDQKHYHKL